MLSPSSFLLPSLVKWKISFVVHLIFHFSNECEQTVPGWPYFESEMELQPQD